jgi:heat-inducible transcriptional repressor
MELNERKKKILKAIVETFVQTAEPVGSKTIAADTDLGLSSATIRNEMAELTAMGYLEQPHTSAGRVPSPQGYRMYVNELMNEHRLSLQETQEINRALKQKISQLDQLLADAGKLVSELTNYPAYTLAAPPPNTVIKRFDCIYVDANTVIAVAMLDNNTVKNKLMVFPEGIEEGFVKKLGSVFNANFTGIRSSDITPNLISAAERSMGDKLGAVAAMAGFAINALEEAVPKRAFVAGASHLLTQPDTRTLKRPTGCSVTFRRERSCCRYRLRKAIPA